MIAKIGKLNVCFSTDSPLLDELLMKEYSLIKTDLPADVSPDVSVNVICRKGYSSDSMRLFKASCRKFYYEISEDMTVLNAIIPYAAKEKDLYELIDSKNCTRCEACLSDILHNMFLVMLELNLLSRGMTLFHSSALASEGGAVLFHGMGGTGKSALVKALCRLKGFSAFAEDFLVLSDAGRVYPLPHMARVSIRAFDAAGAQGRRTDRLNRRICRLTGRRPLRLLTFEQIQNIITVFETEAKAVFLIDRKAKEPSAEPIEKDALVAESAAIMKKEFGNMADCAYVLERAGISEDELIKRVRETVRAAVSGVKTEKLLLPVYPEVAQATAQAAKLCLGLGGEETV